MSASTKGAWPALSGFLCGMPGTVHWGLSWISVSVPLFLKGAKLIHELAS